MTQPSLFTVSPVPAYQRGSQTSKAAAVQAVSFAPSQRERVQQMFATGDGWTQRELSERTGISRQSICLRVRELEKAGVIRKAGQQRAGCEVYEATA